MSRMQHDFKQRQWARDIESHDRLAAIRSRMNCPDSAAATYVQQRMVEIEARYPQHFKHRSHEEKSHG